MRGPTTASRILRRTLCTSSRQCELQRDLSLPGPSRSGTTNPSRRSPPPTPDFVLAASASASASKRKPSHSTFEASLNNKPPVTPTPRDRVQFSLDEGQSNDRRAYFANDVEGEIGEDWGSAEIGDEVPGLESGRVVECRRSGQTSIGLILASILVTGRTRLLLLRSSGEIWPISTHDVQFVMPSSLVPPSLAKECWSPSLLAAWSLASESKAGLADNTPLDDMPSQEMMDARRKVAMTLRKIHRETEKMTGRLMGGSTSKVGGVESVWETWAPEGEERTSVTAVEAAEYILNPDSGSSTTNRVEVKPNTLPAYAAHVLLMRRPDLFTADQGDMWTTGTFIVRSRAERHRLQDVQRWVEQYTATSDPESTFHSFIEKAKKAISTSREIRAQTIGEELREYQHSLTEWNRSDLDIISILFSPLIDTRSTQTPPSLALAISIARLISPYPEEAVDRGVIAHLLQDMGMILPWDSLEMSKNTEAEERSFAMSSFSSTTSKGKKVRSEDELLEGNELDHLREDYTSHKVFVIDDPTASELDDGIALERIPGSEDVWVHIHIADPTRYIPPSHPLAQKASVRGSSLYLPEGNKPLFPLEVIMKELSLGADVQRDDGAQGTMTFSARLLKSGRVEDRKVKMGWIKKPRVITYAQVDEALGVPAIKSLRPFGALSSSLSSSSATPVKAKNEISSDDLEDLKTLYTMAQAHRARRFSTAGLEWSLPSASTSFLRSPPAPSPNLFDVSHLPTSPQLFTGSLQLDYRVNAPASPVLNSANLVAEYMILAGRLAASFCTDHSIPIVYRGSAAPKPISSSISTTLEHLLAARQEGTGMIDPYKMLEPGWYRPAGYISLAPSPHWIMGFDDTEPHQVKGYVRATSPLRRYDDMLVHWQIKSYLAKEAGETEYGTKMIEKEEVARLVKRSDEGVKRAKRAGINAQKFWQARAIQQRFVIGGQGHHPSATAAASASTHINDDDFVDLQKEMIARIAGPSESAPTLAGEMTPIIVENLGMVGKMIHTSSASATKEWKVGEEVKVRLDKVVSWPNPHFQLKLVE
nr:uncharacterized protein CI109_001903 [Kwoniella shandongensis]KAA5529478.1 hypothetical protein CI109_001903 [Kwoniella shandongensis]